MNRFIVALAVLIFAFAPVAKAAVAIDAFSVGQTTGGWVPGNFSGKAAQLDANGSANPTDVNQGLGFITIGASATALIVGIEMASEMHGADDPGTVTVTLNPSGSNQVMTQLGPLVSQTGTLAGPTYLFGLVSPASGTGNIHIAWTNNTNNRQEFYVYAISFTGTSTTSTSTAFYSFATANDGGSCGSGAIFNGVTTSAAVASGDMAFSMHVNDGFTGPGFSDPALNATGTEMDRAQNFTNNTYGQYFTGSGSAILAEADNSSTFGTGGCWAAAVVAIGTKPAGAAGSTPSLTLTGVGGF